MDDAIIAGTAHREADEHSSQLHAQAVYFCQCRMTGCAVALHIQEALCNLANMRLQYTRLEGCKAMKTVLHRQLGSSELMTSFSSFSHREATWQEH